MFLLCEVTKARRKMSGKIGRAETMQRTLSEFLGCTERLTQEALHASFGPDNAVYKDWLTLRNTLVPQNKKCQVLPFPLPLPLGALRRLLNLGNFRATKKIMRDIRAMERIQPDMLAELLAIESDKTPATQHKERIYTADVCPCCSRPKIDFVTRAEFAGSVPIMVENS